MIGKVYKNQDMDIYIEDGNVILKQGESQINITLPKVIGLIVILREIASKYGNDLKK